MTTTTASKRSTDASAAPQVLALEPPPIDATRWPDVANVPDGRLRAAVARRLFAGVVQRLAVQIALPDGAVFGGGRAGDPVMRLVRPDAFYRRLGEGGLIGFGEAFMAGDWDAGDLAGLLTVFAREMSTLIPPRLQRLRDLAVQHQPRLHRATTAASKRNIAHHYDLSNELFALFLDPSMTYSSALFEETPGANRILPQVTAARLPEGQARKIDHLLDGAHVGADTTVLEIGTGWGELALRAAQRGARVTSITLSEQQRELALQRVADGGVADRVQIQLCDYRNATGMYDAVVSVEMIEAVGYEFWPIYFRTLDERLRPGGRVGLQAITMPDDRMQASRDTYTWILKYIFPGGLIPSVDSIERTVARDTRLKVLDRHAFGLHYAQTLRLWREAFEADPAAVDALGFDATFRRMWSLYLAYSEAGFRSGYLDVYQYIFTK
ncbi:MAG TPA: cyclopropane-fatty-acyl-phospholipid synthase family protein [Frankiaceae bacterium]|jgi:cyclopropane-fatty-acyl-phospholipid synthase|nr:cyclopropane-fatty-acyl-phospholipid synthase family protein [Frankiaceae bacterium]